METVDKWTKKLWWIKKICNRILFNCEKEGYPAICNDIDIA